MHRTVRAIVLGTVRHSDRVNIVNLYTDAYGRMSVVAPASGSSRTSRARRAALLPLSVIETEINVHPSRDIQSLGRVAIVRPNRGVVGHPAKSALALFAANFLTRLLREAGPEPLLWRTIEEGIAALDSTRDAANWHITFLARLTVPLGIRPDVDEYTPNAVFDMREGRYSQFAPLHNDVVRPPESLMPQVLSRLNYRNSRYLRLSRSDRARLLDAMLKYYAIHTPGIDLEKSLAVLRAIFD